VLAAAWDGYLYVVSTQSRQVEARIPGGDAFFGVRLADVVATPDNETAWVSEKDTVKRINFRKGTVVEKIQVKEGESIDGLALSSDGKIMFVSMSQHGEAREAFIAQVNLETRTSDFTIPLSAEHMEVDRNDTRLRVGSPFDDSITVVKVADGSVIGEIPTLVNVRGIRSSSDGTRIFVGGSSSGLLVQVGSPAP
jgi:DNA-binding beta-propeller fold protein YncE